MAKFVIRPRRYADQLDAVMAKIADHRDKGGILDPKRNPNGKMELLLWCAAEIKRLRESCAVLKAIVDLGEDREATESQPQPASPSAAPSPPADP